MTQPAFFFDTNLCTGCAACAIACQVENDRLPVPGKPAAPPWRDIYSRNPANSPDLPGFHLSLACNHCLEPACLKACPAAAISKDSLTGAVLIDPRCCIGCGYCAWACPFDAPRYNPGAGVMEKCTFCQPRLRSGGQPACITACPTGALRLELLSAEIPGATTSLSGFPKTTLKPAIRFAPLRADVIASEAQHPPLHPVVASEAQQSPLHAVIASEAQQSPLHAVIASEAQQSPLHAVVASEARQSPLHAVVASEAQQSPLHAVVASEARQSPLHAVVASEARQSPLHAVVASEARFPPLYAVIASERSERSNLDFYSPPENTPSLAHDWPLWVFTSAFPALFAWFAAFPAHRHVHLAWTDLLALLLGGLALLVSTLHLGRPWRAWRALLNLNTSWLSREILFTGVFLVISAAAFGLPRIGTNDFLYRSGLVVQVSLLLLGFLALLSMDMVYAVLRFQDQPAAELYRPRLQLHSALVMLNGVYLAGIVALSGGIQGQALQAGLAGAGLACGALQLGLYADRHAGKEPATAGQALARFLRVGLGFALPAVLLAVNASGWMAPACVLLGAAIDRAEFYSGLRRVKPGW